MFFTLSIPEKIHKSEIPFYNEMLSWPPGRRKSDGIWGKYWYKKVEDSTGFQPYTEKEGAFQIKYNPIYSACLELYEVLYQERIK